MFHNVWIKNTIVIVKSLLMSLFTFLLISIINSKRTLPYVQISFKSWKSWLMWALSASFSSLQSITMELAAIKTTKWLNGKNVRHMFFVKFGVLQRKFLQKYLVYQAQNYQDIWNQIVWLSKSTLLPDEEDLECAVKKSWSIPKWQLWDKG